MKNIVNKLFIANLIILLFSCNTSTQTKHTMGTTNGLVIKQSKFDFNTTYDKLHSIIEANPNLKIILELDHSKNAASKDLELRPTKIILFGNPMLGTPLMQASATSAIDLPQKIVVFEEKGQVNIAYNDPIYLKERHSIENLNEVITKIANALDNITNKAAGNQ